MSLGVIDTVNAQRPQIILLRSEMSGYMRFWMVRKLRHYVKHRNGLVLSECRACFSLIV